MRRGLVEWLLVGALASVPLACSSGAEDVCDARCDCEYCSERDYDLCVDQYDAWDRDADRWDCGDIYDAWIDCLLDSGYCDRGEYVTSCGHIRSDLEHCTRY